MEEALETTSISNTNWRSNENRKSITAVGPRNMGIMRQKAARNGDDGWKSPHDRKPFQPRKTPMERKKEANPPHANDNSPYPIRHYLILFNIPKKTFQGGQNPFEAIFTRIIYGSGMNSSGRFPVSPALPIMEVTSSKHDISGYKNLVAFFNSRALAKAVSHVLRGQLQANLVSLHMTTKEITNVCIKIFKSSDPTKIPHISQELISILCSPTDSIEYPVPPVVPSSAPPPSPASPKVTIELGPKLPTTKKENETPPSPPPITATKPLEERPQSVPTMITTMHDYIKRYGGTAYVTNDTECGMSIFSSPMLLFEPLDRSKHLRLPVKGDYATANSVSPSFRPPSPINTNQFQVSAQLLFGEKQQHQQQQQRHQYPPSRVAQNATKRGCQFPPLSPYSRLPVLVAGGGVGYSNEIRNK